MYFQELGKKAEEKSKKIKDVLVITKKYNKNAYIFY